MKNSDVQISLNTAFEQQVNLWNIIGQNNTIHLLQILVDFYHAEKEEGKHTNFPSILLFGNDYSGKRTVSIATHNSFGNQEFKETSGRVLGMGEDFKDFFIDNSTEHTTHYVSELDKMNSYNQNLIRHVIKDKVVPVFYPFKNKKETIPLHDRLIILSAKKPERILESINKCVDIYCFLNNEITKSHLYQILQQRCKIMTWDVDKEILKTIADVAIHSSQAVELLLLAYKIMRCKGESKITISHFNQALHLLNSNISE